MGRNSSNWRMYDLICEQCGVTYVTPDPRRRLCSRTCLHNWMRATRIGASNPNYRTDMPVCLVCSKPITRSKRTRGQFCSARCMGVARVGAANPAWRGGSTARHEKGFRYRSWREAVFSRDKWICQDCSVYRRYGRGRYALHAHHLLSWAEHPTERFEVNNGVTLCAPCHRKRHSAIAQLRRDGSQIAS